MFRFGTLLCVLFCLLPFGSRATAQRAADGPTDLTVAVSDFAGSDRESSRFITETLLTDLAQSDQLHVVERAEFRQALTEFNLAPTSLFEPSQIRRIGRRLDADRIVVGSFFVRADRATLNARLLDARTGRPVPGGAANVSGDSSDLLALTHRLARLLHRHATGSDLTLDEDEDTASSASDDDPPVISRVPGDDTLEPLRSSGLIPKSARPGGLVSEREMARLVTRVALRLDSESHASVTVMQPSAPMTRLRALVALVRVAVSPDEIAGYRSDPPEATLADMASVPAWGRPYVAAATDRGWWPDDRPLRAREPATWGFVASVLAQLPLDEDKDSAPDDAPPVHPTRERHDTDTAKYSGLVIDARDLDLQRQMSPRILDEDGQVVYPDPAHIPGDDYLQEKGMADYTESVDSAKRAGIHPLVVTALNVSGPGHDDLVVSNATAQQIRAANRHGKFLSRWSVCILTKSHS
jgi:TolB-like protein